MSTHKVLQKHSRRRLAALNFLSNISLDGSVHENNKCKPPCKTSSVKEDLSKSQESYMKYDNQEYVSATGNQHLCDNKKLIESTNQCSPNELKSLASGAVKKDLLDQQLSKKNSGNLTANRERSATLDGTSKHHPSPAVVHSNLNHPLILNGVVNPNTSEKTPNEHFEQPSSNFLFPTSVRSRRISSNTSEGSYSPTGSAIKDREVKFLTPGYDWSSQVTDQRLVLVTCHCSPVVLFSTLPFSRVSKLSRGDFRSESGRRRHASSGTRPVSSTDLPDLYQLIGFKKPENGQVVSYRQMLVPSSHSSTSCVRCLVQDTVSHVYRSNHGRPASPLQTVTENIPKITDCEDGHNTPSFFNFSNFTYHPSLLDDPEFIVGKHSTRIALLTFSSYMTSVIDYVKPSDLKKELNDKFREKFPHIHLTLSKIRSLKKEMRKVAEQDSGTDLLTVAQSYVYFEKLILRGLVHKGNRKLCAGASLLLSAKMNDVKGDTLKTLIEVSLIDIVLHIVDLDSVDHDVATSISGKLRENFRTMSLSDKAHEQQNMHSTIFKAGKTLG